MTGRALFSKTEKFSDLNRRLVRHFKLPDGARFALKREKGAPSDRPYLRADIEIKRKLFHRKDHPIYIDDTVREVTLRVEALLAPHCRQKVVAIDETGREVGGMKQVGNWSPAAVPRPTRAGQIIQDDMMDDLTVLFIETVDMYEEGVENPENLVVEAALAALVDAYGEAAVHRGVARICPTT
jgi:hypothetical protein